LPLGGCRNKSGMTGGVMADFDYLAIDERGQE
jgi:hypothetical protein